jgi:hypothetical protein
MVIYDLACGAGHRFEGWFQSLEACEEQASSGQLICPVCGARSVRKQVTGSAIKRSKARVPGVGVAQAAPPAAPPAPPLPEAPTPTPNQIREFLGVLSAHVRANSEDVGPRFAEEARRIHRGQAEARMIRGEATAQEEDELRQEAVPFLKLPLAVDD